MELFEIVNNHAVPSVHALLISPFKEIWEQDDTKYKEYSIKIFTYVELVCNPRKSNPFAGYSEEERPKKVKKMIFGEDNPDIEHAMINDIIECTLTYKELLQNSSPSYGLWVDAMEAVDKLRRFLRDFDLDERTKSGGLVIKPADITNAIAKLPDVEKAMQTQRDKVQGELTNSTKTRNQREIGAFER